MSHLTRSNRPFDALRGVLSADEVHLIDSAAGDDAEMVRPDPGRRTRTGIPEVVLAGSKSLPQVVESLVRLATVSGRALASRCPVGMIERLPDALLAAGDFACDVHADAAAVIAIAEGHPEAEVQSTGGVVGIITAGTSDGHVAAEAGLIAAEMGCEVVHVRDAGVAGLHRLVQPLEALLARNVGALIVVAGMDGALPSVVAGLVDVPVIGLPSSVGYGMGGGGEAALLAMLQSCAPGLVVVNIDNGIGAGAAAARIANRSLITLG